MTDTTGPIEDITDIVPSLKDSRNVADKYKWWQHQDIVEDLAAGRSGFATVCMNLDGDFNLSSLVRNSNWFNNDSVWIVGQKHWDRRGAVGTHHYMQVEYRKDPLETIAELKELGYTVVAAEIAENSVNLNRYRFPYKVAVLFGEEGLGLSEDILAACDAIVSIPGRGSVRSLNVANTGGIFLWEYSKQWFFDTEE